MPSEAHEQRGWRDLCVRVDRADESAYESEHLMLAQLLAAWPIVLVVLTASVVLYTRLLALEHTIATMQTTMIDFKSDIHPLPSRVDILSERHGALVERMAAHERLPIHEGAATSQVITGLSGEILKLREARHLADGRIMQHDGRLAMIEQVLHGRQHDSTL